MTWADFYLVCFVVGLFLSVLLFVTGGLHFHTPHVHIQVPGLHGGGGGVHAGPAHGGRGGRVSSVNPFTLTVFLAWFGGTGYLLSRHSTVWFFTALVISLLAGAGGAAVIYLFSARILSSPDEALDPADFEMVGVLGRLSVRIREGGTGEMIYSQAGTRRVCAARSEDGTAIVRGTEVVVTRYERGVAYVRCWAELSGEDRELGRAQGAKADEEARTQ